MIGLGSDKQTHSDIFAFNSIPLIVNSSILENKIPLPWIRPSKKLLSLCQLIIPPAGSYLQINFRRLYALIIPNSKQTYFGTHFHLLSYRPGIGGTFSTTQGYEIIPVLVDKHLLRAQWTQG